MSGAIFSEIVFVLMSLMSANFCDWAQVQPPAKAAQSSDQEKPSRGFSGDCQASWPAIYGKIFRLARAPNPEPPAKTTQSSDKKERLQRFWQDYYDSLQAFYKALDPNYKLSPSWGCPVCGYGGWDNKRQSSSAESEWRLYYSKQWNAKNLHGGTGDSRGWCCPECGRRTVLNSSVFVAPVRTGPSFYGDPDGYGPGPGTMPNAGPYGPYPYGPVPYPYGPGD